MYSSLVEKFYLLTDPQPHLILLYLVQIKPTILTNVNDQEYENYKKNVAFLIQEHQSAQSNQFQRLRMSCVAAVWLKLPAF